MMAAEGAGEVRLLRALKAKLIDILSADADFVLQHADSRFLLSRLAYQRVKSCRVPSEKVTELLDHIIQRGPKAIQGLLKLLGEQSLQETFPQLCFIQDKDLQVKTLPSECENILAKRKAPPGLQDIIPAKSSKGSGLVREKQLISVARKIGRSWREIGRLALEIPSVKLEQIEEDHSIHVERVFAMLRYWCTSQREKATAAHLHSLLSQDDWALPPESISVLLESD